MRHALAGLALCALGGLAGCGNDPALQGNLPTLRALGGVLGPALGGGGAPPPAAATPEAVARVLARLPEGPALRVALPRTGQSAFAVRAARNGPHRVFATPTGQTITLAGGVVTATRGFAGDLMSADTGGLAARLADRAPGRVDRVYRFLDGTDSEVPLSAACRLAREGGETVTLVSGARFATVRLVESCRAQGRTWRNRYWVTAAGAVKRSHQWAGPGLGHMRIEAVRD